MIYVGTPVRGTTGRGYIIGIFVILAVETACTLMTHRLLKLDRINNIDIPRVIFMCAMLFLEVYFKWIFTAIKEMRIESNQTMMLSFSIFAALGLFIMTLFFDYNRQVQGEKDDAEHERLALEYQMKNARRELQANSDVRRLYHDTKNHLMAIRSMAGKSGEIEEYLDGLLSHFNSYEAQIDTGNATVNALLSDKIQRAHPEEILFNVRLDLSALNKVSSIDLVTIFGNAIDNAVEALRSIDDDGKIVFIKNKYFA